MRGPIKKIIDPSYNTETMEKKVKFMLKLSYDTIFYSATTVTSYLTFRNEYWFPSSVGGCGACSNLYREYPNWPADSNTSVEIYFCFQLGVHIFSVFELVVFKKNDQKFYEWMLHHFMAASLILFSLMSNQVAAGLMILIIHDASDIFMAGSRFYVEAYIKKNKLITGFLVGMLMVSWFYFRIFIFPLCLLSNVYKNRPLPTD